MVGMWKKVSHTLCYSRLFSRGSDADKRVSCETFSVFTGNRSPAQRASVPCALNQPSSLRAHLFPVGSAGMCMTEKITSFARPRGFTQSHTAWLAITESHIR